MKRTEKIILLKRVLQGQTAELEQLRTKRGRLYTEEERAAQQAYLSLLFNREVTSNEVSYMFGRYDFFCILGAQAYELPNGMLIYF